MMHLLLICNINVEIVLDIVKQIRNTLFKAIAVGERGQNSEINSTETKDWRVFEDEVG